MEEKITSGITIDQCKNCKSIWFDNKELLAFCIISGFDKSKVVSTLNHFEYLPEKRIFICPRCENYKLNSARVKWIDVLNCKRCHGIFISNEAIATFLQKHSKTEQVE